MPRLFFTRYFTAEEDQIMGKITSVNYNFLENYDRNSDKADLLLFWWLSRTHLTISINILIQKKKQEERQAALLAQQAAEEAEKSK